MNKPSITPGTGFVNYTWPEFKLRIMAKGYGADSHAEILFFSNNGTDEVLLDRNRVNLLSASTKHVQARKLERIREDVPWDDALTWVTHLTLELAQQGEPVEKIWPSEEDNLVPSYLLEPLLYQNHPTVIFGDYGSLKSLFALAVGYVAQLPYSNNKLGLITAKESTHCLYLDYEDDPSSFRKRWSAISKGFGIEAPMSILYRRMTSTLIDSVESLQSIIANEEIGLLIIDSLGPAARGNLNDPEPAIRYHEALRKFGITSLTLAHCSKDQLTRKRTIFGSIFFTNLARAVWECKAEQEAGEDEAIISLRHTKANLSKLHSLLGYKFTFTNDSITIAKTDLRDTGLSGELPLSVRIKDLLRDGAMTVKQIAEALEANEGSVKTIVNRMGKKDVTIKIGEAWGLKAL